MAFSEKIYTLRRKSGLSQEQLAEQLGVSRQAISKWESGQSVPESDKLLAVSNYFNVSLDFLMKEEEPKADGGGGEAPERRTWLADRLPGIILCVGGVVCLIIWGILSIADPGAANRLSESSTVRIDGSGIFLLLCVAAMAAGAALILRGGPKK